MSKRHLIMLRIKFKDLPPSAGPRVTYNPSFWTLSALPTPFHLSQIIFMSASLLPEISLLAISLSPFLPLIPNSVSIQTSKGILVNHLQGGGRKKSLPPHKL